MKRGEIWSVSASADYVGRPRPAVIVQDDRFEDTASVTICAFTTNEVDAPHARLLVEPSDRNGLQVSCRLMVDKISTVPKFKVGARIGTLDNADIARLNRSMLVFLGLATSPVE